MKMRTWQVNACRGYVEDRLTDALWVATPGGGKTRAAVRLAHALLTKGDVTQCIVVVPKSHLRGQFAQSMAMAGIDLDEGHQNDMPMADDMRGVVVTYQQVALKPRWFKGLCQRPTLVVMDEIHHASDDSTWGSALREAFGHSASRLSLSGTPFRTKGDPIPFVRYDSVGQCYADYEFDYTDALRAGVCRRLVFPTYKGFGQWISSDGTEKSASFGDRLTVQEQAELLRTVLWSKEYVANMVADAHKTLEKVRGGVHPAAGALAVCMDEKHARFVAQVIQEVTGETPTIVVSADGVEASKNIVRFSNSTQKWIVAVHMVSEGVDIPRLRIACFLSNVKTDMYFRQFCGRVVRAQDTIPGEQPAFVYLPYDERLLAFARNIHGEVKAVLKERKDADEAAEALAAAQREGPRLSMYAPLSASAERGDIIHGDEQTLQNPHGDKPLVAAESAPVGAPSSAAPVSLAEQKKALRREISQLVSRISREEGVEHAKVYGTMTKRIGGKLDTATIEQLQERKTTCLNWRQKGYDGAR